MGEASAGRSIGASPRLDPPPPSCAAAAAGLRREPHSSCSRDRLASARARSGSMGRSPVV